MKATRTTNGIILFSEGLYVVIKKHQLQREMELTDDHQHWHIRERFIEKKEEKKLRNVSFALTPTYVQ